MNWDDIKDDITKLGVATFGSGRLFKPIAGGSYPIAGVFDRAWMELKLGGTVGVSGYYSYLDVRLDDLPAKPIKGDKVAISSVDYTIIDCREDGGGGARLVLQK